MNRNNVIDLKHVGKIENLVKLLIQQEEFLKLDLKEFRFHYSAPIVTKNINTILVNIIRYIRKDITQLKKQISKNSLVLHDELIPYRRLLAKTYQTISKICENSIVKPTEKARLQICVDKLEQVGELFNMAMPPLQKNRKRKTRR